MALMTSMEPGAADILNEPSALALVPLLFPFILMDAPAIGAPVESVIFPVISLF
jgi:hypothetical protein